MGVVSAGGVAHAHGVERTSTVAVTAATDVNGSSARTETWRERYAQRFVTRVKDRDWPWVRKQGGSTLVRSAKAMPGKQRLRVLGDCYVEGNGGAFCYLSNYYALTFNRLDSGRIRVDGLYVQD